MGTPRYMSPEQAESLQRPIDHRTDVYSLGASLYELATGRPVFESATPHGVIAQILTEEPARPRQIRPDLPRDLETIILTCLAKEPAQRYATAQALAEDLRAVLRRPADPGPPRPARRARVAVRPQAEEGARPRCARRGGDGPAHDGRLVPGLAILQRLAARPRRADDRRPAPDGGRCSPSRATSRSASRSTSARIPPLSLPAGDYRLRVHGQRACSVRRIASRSTGARPGIIDVSLDENRLLDEQSIPFPSAGDALVLKPGKADFIEWTGGHVAPPRPSRPASRSGTPGDRKEPSAPGHDPFAWMRRLALIPGDEERPGTLVQPAPDLDGDGTGDIVWPSPGTPSLLAVSGRDGSMLWTYSAAVDGPGGPDPLGPDELAKALEGAIPAGRRDIPTGHQGRASHRLAGPGPGRRRRRPRPPRPLLRIRRPDRHRLRVRCRRQCDLVR